MTTETQKPIIFLAFANEPPGARGHLRNLGEEARQLETTLTQAQQAGLCELVIKSYASLDDILGVFRAHRNRIAVFHYAGHADSYHLLLESDAGTAAADAGGLAAFLGGQRGLQLVFLNGCSTQPQVEALLAANVSLVIATSQAIKDEVAMNFAGHFYQSLASGASVQTAYAEAEAAVRASVGSGDTSAGYQSSSRDLSLAGVELLADRWPWALYAKPGAEASEAWNLPDAAGDPLFGLPLLPEMDLPDSPFRHLNYFERRHAPVFFGRGYQIRDLYERVTTGETAPIILLYGQSGVGKSSLLAAGLLPRLEADYGVGYARREREAGLCGSLAEALGASPQTADLAGAWQVLEQDRGKPVVVVLDQVEEVFTRPNPDRPDELAEFPAALHDIFADPARRPHGKLILGFRKEWLAEIESQLIEHKLPRAKVFLERLDRRGVMEAVEGTARSERLRGQYGLAVEEGLSGLIADDLLADRGSPIAPTLQILLTKMWDRATQQDASQPRFDQALYQALKKEGIGLPEFLDQQLDGLRRWRAEAVDSGLAVDVLAYHTTPLGTAEKRTREELQATYRHRAEALPGLVQKCIDLYLLVDPAERGRGERGASQLSHDALAPLVRQCFETSDRPGQRARRILENRTVEWEDGREGAPLDEEDLALAEAGCTGMRAWTSDEERLVAASRQEQAKRQRNRRGLRVAGIVAVLLVLLSAGIALSERNSAVHQAAVSQSTALSANAQRAIADNDYDLAIPLALAANQIVDPPSLAVNALAAAAYVPGTQRLLAGHSADVTGVAFSPDVAYALTGSLDKSARLWDTKTGEVVHQLDQTQLAAGVTSVAYSPTGEQALLGLENGSLVVWDVTTGGILHHLAGPSQGITQAISALVYSPDGQRALTGDNAGGLMLWDVASGKSLLRLPGHKEGVTAVAISPDGHTALSGARDNRMVLWNLDTGQAIQQFEGHTDDVILVAYGPLAGNVISGSKDGTVVVWSIETGKPQQGFPLSRHTQAIGSIAVAPDDATVISGGWDGSVILWDKLPLGAYVRSFVGHRAPVISLAYSKDGRYVLSGAKDGTVRLWDIGGPAQLRRFTIEPTLLNRPRIDPLHNLALDEAHHRAFSGAAGALILWDLETGEEIHRFPAPVDRLSSVALSPDGTTALSAADGDLTLWNLTTYTAVLTLAGHSTEVLNIAYAADGQTALSASRDGVVIGWNLETGQSIWRHDLPKDDIWSIAFSADGSRALTGSEDRSVILWDLATGQEIRRFVGHHDAVYWVAISPDEQTVLTGSADRQVILWDLATGQSIRTFQGHTLPVHTVAYSPDGATILSGGEDHTVRLWDIATGAEIFRFEGHSATIQNVLYLRKQPRILSRANDGTLILWQFPPADQSLQHLDSAYLQQWTQDHRYARELTCDEKKLYNVEPLCQATP